MPKHLIQRWLTRITTISMVTATEPVTSVNAALGRRFCQWGFDVSLYHGVASRIPLEGN